MTHPQRIRYGMVGGGPGSLIGPVHRRAAALDGHFELAAGAFSSDPETSRQHGAALDLDPARVYGSFEEMAEREASLPAGERIQLVVIAVPNHLHFAVAKAFIERGIHVACDKPLTTDLDDAETLCRLADRHDVVLAVTYNYTGYPMVKEAREQVQSDALGRIRKVSVEHVQGWLRTAREEQGDKQAAWRTDPERAGVAGVLGDLGTHAEHLARYVTGLCPQSLFAETTTFVEGRALEDDATVLLRYGSNDDSRDGSPDGHGARGVLHTSQVAAGEENNLRLRVWGTNGALEWCQETPNALVVRRPDGPEEVYRRGNDYLSTPARESGARVPPGHPEGFIEAFASLYANVAQAVRAHAVGNAPDAATGDFPTARDGATGVHFVHRAVESSRRARWVEATYPPPR